MKKAIISLILSTFLFSENVLADWSTHRYFQCKVTKKFTARAKLKPPGATFYTQTYDGGCGFAEAELSSLAVNGDQNGCAFVRARADGGNSNQRTGFAKCGWNWGSNVDYLKPFFPFIPMFSSESKNYQDEENLTSAELNDDGINFDDETRKISITNLNGFLKISSNDLANSFTTFQIKIYTFTIENNEIINSEILWMAKASIINGQLYLEGNFDSNEFTNNSLDNNINYSIIGVNKLIYINPEIDIENVCVEISGDGTNLGIGVSEEYSPNLNTLDGKEIINDILNSNVFNFNLITNNNYAEVAILKNTNNLQVGEISIVSLTGIIQKRKVIDNQSEQLGFDISELSNGVYLFTVRIGNQFYSKKFIK